MARLNRPGILIPLFFNVTMLGVLPSFARERFTPLLATAIFLSLVTPWLVSYLVAWVSESRAREETRRRREKDHADFV